MTDVILDPMASRILKAAKKLSFDRENFTINDLIEESNLGYAVIRKRLALLAERGDLICLPGTGRSPSVYFLPQSSAELKAKMTDDELLLLLNQREAALIKELEAVQQDRKTVERAIAMRSKYIDRSTVAG